MVYKIQIAKPSHEGLFFLELCGDFTEFFSIPETEITYYMIY